MFKKAINSHSCLCFHIECCLNREIPDLIATPFFYSYGAREVNKIIFWVGKFLIFLPQKTGKLINWVGNLQFLSALTQIMCFPGKFWDMPPFQCHHPPIHNVGFHEQEFWCVLIVQQTWILTNFRTTGQHWGIAYFGCIQVGFPFWD